MRDVESRMKKEFKKPLLYKRCDGWYVKVQSENERVHQKAGETYVEAIGFVKKMKREKEPEKTKNLYKRGNSWYCNLQINGIRLNHKAGDSLEEAKEYVKRIKEEYKQKKVRSKMAGNRKKTNYSAYDLSKVVDKIPEIYLENYLQEHIEQLEEGLRIVNRQVFISTGRLDLVAEDARGNKIYIELKTDSSEKLGLDKLCGQVSRYFNDEIANNVKIYLVLPHMSGSRLTKIQKTLAHWIKNGLVNVYHFDYSIYSKKFTFQRLV